MGSYFFFWMGNEILYELLRCIISVTVFTNSAGFLIRCMRLFDAIREELVPYGTQTFPSVASASLCLIKRNLRRYLLNFVVHIFSQADISICQTFFRSLLVQNILFFSHPPRRESQLASLRCKMRIKEELQRRISMIIFWYYLLE